MNKFKKIVLFISIMIILSSCTTIQSNTENPKQTLPSNEKEEINLVGENTDSAIRIYFEFLDKFLQSEEQISVTNFIQDEFKQEYLFIEKPKLTKDGILGANGIMSLHIYDLVNVYASRNELLSPITNVFDDSELCNVIPDYVISDLTDGDGQIWSFPASVTFKKAVRVFDNEIMENYELDIPGNFYEFVSILSIVQENKPDEPLINVKQNKPLTPFLDIFSANGCYIYDEKSTIGWNHKTKSIEDFALYESMKNALIEIAVLRDLGYISIETNSLKAEAEKPFTTITANYNGLSEAYYSFSLNEDNIEYLEYDPTPYFVIPKNTEKHIENFKCFLETFICDINGNLIGKFGMNNTIANFDNPQLVSLNVEKLREVGEFALVGKWIPINPYVLVGSNDDNINARISSYADYVNFINVGLENNKLMTIPIWPNLNTLGFRDNKIDSIFSNMFYEFITTDREVDDFIASYKIAMKTNYGGTYLDYLNSKISKTTSTRY